MTLPETIQIASYNINTFGLFLLLGFLLASFVVWQEGNKDGFDEEHILDTLILSTLVGVLFSRFVFAVSSGATLIEALRHTYKVWTPGMDIFGGFVGVLTPIYFLSRFWKWSIYRIYDIFSLAWSLGLAIIMLGYVGLQQRFEFLFAFAAWLLIYATLVKVRNSKIRSGAVFSLFLTINAGLGVWFFNQSRYLLFYVLLVTISAVNLYFRRKKSAGDSFMLPTNFIQKVKERLLKKDSDLKQAEKLLKKEDPYLQSGREDDNADVAEEVAEDVGHSNVQVRISSIQRARAQIKRALQRIAEGTYGKDEKSGELIPKERLEVYPEATTTTANADDEEK